MIKPPISTIAIAILAFCAGTTVSFFTLPIWIVPLIEAGRDGARSDWLGFAGALLAGMLTATVASTAIFFATKSIRDQISVGLYSREEDRIEALLPGLKETQMVLVHATHVADRFLAFAEVKIRPGQPIDPTIVAHVHELKASLHFQLSRQSLPNISDAMRRDLGMRLDHLAATADAATEARLEAERAGVKLSHATATDREVECREEFQREEGAFYSQLAAFTFAIDTTKKYLEDLNRRIGILSNRLRVYNREIERLLPTGRD